MVKILSRLSVREKFFMSVGLISILGILSYMYILEPLWGKWQTINKNIYLQERQLLKNIKIMAQKEMIAQLYEKHAQSLKMKGSVEEETAVILSEIENVARKNSGHITDIKPHRVRDMEFYKEYAIELEVEGDIANLTKFIYDLGNSEQILRVRHLRLNAKSGGENVLKAYMIVTKILVP